MKPMRLLIVLAVLTAVGGIAEADPYVTATYRPLQTGYRLDFVLYLDLWHGSCHQWVLWTTAATDLAAPLGWEAGISVRDTEWYTRFPQYQVPPGGVLRGSAATFAVLPTELGYLVEMTAPGGPYGGTLVPVPVPEPSSILALASGAVWLLLLRRRR